MAKLTKEEVKHVAHLARLAITDEEAEKFAEQLGKITDFAEQLNELEFQSITVEVYYFDKNLSQ